MRARRVGDATVSAVALGTASLVIDESVSADQAMATIDAAVDAGLTAIDTAAVYASSTDLRAGERLVGAAIRRHPHLFAATKGGHTREPGGWQVDGRHESIVKDCNESLRILGVDSIDLYYLHKPDPNVPFLDSVGALRELRDAGKIARVGLSNVSVEQLAKARNVVEVDAVQNRFGPLDRVDADCLRTCQREGIAYLPYSPLGGEAGSGSLADRFPGTAALAQQRAISLPVVLLAWVIAQGPAVIPIVGARRPASITDSARAGGLELDALLVAQIEADLQA